MPCSKNEKSDIELLQRSKKHTVVLHWKPSSCWWSWSSIVTFSLGSRSIGNALFFFWKRVPVLWRYLDRLRGIAGGSLPSAGVQGGRSQRRKLVGKQDDHKWTTSKWCHNLKLFFGTAANQNQHHEVGFVKPAFYEGKKRWSFCSKFPHLIKKYCLIHRQTEWLNFNSPVPNHISWSDLQIFFQKSLVRWL